MDKQDIAIEIYYELDTIRFMTKLCKLAIEHEDGPKLEIHNLDVVFRDIYKRSWQISEMVEKLERWDDPMFPESLKAI